MDLGHSNKQECWIDEDLSRENVSQISYREAEAENVTDNIDDIIDSIAASESDTAVNNQHQRHLHVSQVNSQLVTSQLRQRGDIISDSNAKISVKSDISDQSVPQTPQKSNFEKIRLSFEAKIRGNASTVKSTPKRTPSDSPSLIRLMQLNEKKLSESLKTKKVKSQQKKLKKKNVKRRLKVLRNLSKEISLGTFRKCSIRCQRILQKVNTEMISTLRSHNRVKT